MRRVLQDVSAATAVLGFAWMIAMWGSVLGAAWGVRERGREGFCSVRRRPFRRSLLRSDSQARFRLTRSWR